MTFKLFQNTVFPNDIKAFPIKNAAPLKPDYALVQECKQQGYQQVIVTLAIFWEIICCIYKDEIGHITEIRFISNNEAETECAALIAKINRNSAYLVDLDKQIRLLEKSSSTDVKYVHFKLGKSLDGKGVRVWVNGIIEFEEYNKTVLDRISELVHMCL